jgi:uncharacterized membrane protein YdbT with pleckstrin-like domain
MSDKILFRCGASQVGTVIPAITTLVLTILFLSFSSYIIPFIDGIFYKILDNPPESDKVIGYIFNTIIVMLLWTRVLWSYLVIKNTEYVFCEDRLMINHGVINKEFDYTEYYRIKDYAVKRPLIARMFKLNNIEIISTDRSHPFLNLRLVTNFQDKEPVLRNLIEDSATNGRGREIDVV